ncbi:MAG TPA: DUF86 domain-containing protein [Candidatus Acidoferrum sp.]|nr:DUF86 domain-containing protein [Candidatus Acidoferrum sp.]
MKLESRKLLLDALEACDSIAQHLSGISFNGYRDSRLLRRAVEREFEIIGEALNRLSKADPVVAEQIVELRRVVDFRNRIVHGYGTVDDEAVWDIAQVHLAILSQQLRALLGSAEPPIFLT